jgi:hypothetical protein
MDPCYVNQNDYNDQILDCVFFKSIKHKKKCKIVPENPVTAIFVQIEPYI